MEKKGTFLCRCTKYHEKSDYFKCILCKDVMGYYCDSLAVSWINTTNCVCKKCIRKWGKDLICENCSKKLDTKDMRDWEFPPITIGCHVLCIHCIDCIFCFGRSDKIDLCKWCKNKSMSYTIY